MKKRIGDRRRGPRFEIVGALNGTLETWQRSRLLNLGAGGALIESPVPLLPGSRITGRVGSWGQVRELRALVRRIDADGAPQRYAVAVEWAQPLADSDALLTADTVPQRRDERPAGTERRRSVRIAPRGPSEIEWPTWLTVELIDISTTGVLFTSPMPLGVGDKAHIRMRLGDRAFAAEVEMRRELPRAAKQTGCRVGAAFASLDESNRLALHEFLGDQRA